MPPPPSPLTGTPVRIWIDSKKAQGTVRRTVPWVSSVDCGTINRIRSLFQKDKVPK